MVSAPVLYCLRYVVIVVLVHLTTATRNDHRDVGHGIVVPVVHPRGAHSSDLAHAAPPLRTLHHSAGSNLRGCHVNVLPSGGFSGCHCAPPQCADLEVPIPSQSRQSQSVRSAAEHAHPLAHDVVCLTHVDVLLGLTAERVGNEGRVAPIARPSPCCIGASPGAALHVPDRSCCLHVGRLPDW